MEAGRELDEIVAEKVMGWKWDRRYPTSDPQFIPPEGDPRLAWAAEWDERGIPEYLPEYSTDLGMAWEIVDRVRGSFSSQQWEIWTHELCSNAQILRGDTPIIICLAALKAVGVEVPA